MRVRRGETRLPNEMYRHLCFLGLLPTRISWEVKLVSWEIVTLVLSGICVTLKDGRRWGKEVGFGGQGEKGARGKAFKTPTDPVIRRPM